MKGFWLELFKLWNNINEKKFNPTLKSITFGATYDGCDDVNILILCRKKLIQYCKKINKFAEFNVYLKVNLLNVHPVTENIVNLIRIAFPDFEIAH